MDYNGHKHLRLKHAPIILTSSCTKLSKEGYTINPKHVYSNNQLSHATRLSYNSIPGTASSRQSDVIKSRGHLVYGVHCRHCMRMHAPRIIVYVQTRVYPRNIATCNSEFMKTRSYLGLKSPDAFPG